MLEAAKLKKWDDLIGTASPEELIWINGYLSGIVARTARGPETEAAAAPALAVKKAHLVFGTETGNARKLAGRLAAAARKKGITLKLSGLDQYRLTDLSKEDYFFIVISTQGEGEPPLTAKKFYEHIHASQPDLSQLKFSVLALGDTSYPLYCKTGDDVQQRFKALGATEIIPMQKCDVDYDADADTWFEQVTTLLSAPATAEVAAIPVAPAVKKASGKKYYQGTIITNINLNDRGSNRETYHIELATEESVVYEPGDTIGIVPRNRAAVVDRILELTGADGEQFVTTPKASASIRELLTIHLNICYLMTNTVKKYAALTGQDIPDTRMDLVDLLRIYPVKGAAVFTEVLSLLLPVAPRLYSIASSPAAHGENEVHITVAKDRFLAEDEQRFGLCSEFLGDLPNGSTLNFYVHKSRNFKLPAPDKKIIMIGPGTGVAPFRSFLAERDATGATGENWFFFGEQYFEKDFLYQTEMQSFHQTGVLSRLDLAFSRDQEERRYVQHRMLEQAGEIYSWIEQGAHLYVSGVKDPMSREVEQTLLQIISDKGNKTMEEAAAFLEQLRKENRYEKDVY
ncbi:flavodoxin domain-containing protein [Nostoc ellipsosporum NOK]|nr:flavodoxin domain-containing protein [Nostoc ellipsosporum NOK]